ncbi:MAG: DUF1553 domain-containing protein [Akkermansiaceae bacterium]
MIFRYPYALVAIVAVFAISCNKQKTQLSAGESEGSEDTAVTSPHREVSFNDEVMPILSDKCFHCHGPDAENQKSAFRLDTEEHAKQALKDGGWGIVAGSLKKSSVHERIHATGEDMMPPADSNRSLSEEEKAIIDAWIVQGAEYTEHWAYIPVPKDVPVPEKTSWARNEIDHFVYAKFAEHGLTPAEEISKEKWLRRVTFDLTGLPPTIAELDAFLADKSANAYEKVVDQLFETNAYAERMTNEWMDVARYADTFGYQTDRPRFVWPWRDWVISSFKKNQPYSKFITWQLAGDLLPNATREQIQATTFNRLHSQKTEGGSVEEEFRVEYVADRLHTFGTAFMGLTMECCRCHDHKYDPLPMKAYYEMSAFFANIDEAGLYPYYDSNAPPPPVLALTTEAQEKDIATKDDTLKKAEANVAATKKSEQQAFEAWLADRPAHHSWKGMLSHLTFDAAEGNKFPNSANPKAPSPTNAANKLVAKGVSGKAVQLTGDHAVTVGGVPKVNREVPISFSFWMKPNKHHQRAVVFHQTRSWTDAASRGYELLIENGKLSAAWNHFWPGNALRVKTSGSLPVGEWTHVTVTYDGSSSAAGLKFYINGSRDPGEIIRDQLTKGILGKGDGKGLFIGQRNRDKGFKTGQLDDFKVFSRELSPIEAKQLCDNKSLDALITKTPASLTAQEKKQLFDYYLQNHSVAYETALKELQTARAARFGAYDKVTEIMVMKEMETPKKTHLLDRGLYSERKEEVSAGTPDVLPPFPEGLKKDRLGLAKWLLSEDHPLTSRVTVNRYWQMIFSRGIVATPEDFGSQGDRPTHAALLDWLSRDFMDSGWDVRKLLKRMVLSATYRQSTVTTPEIREKDPKNLYLSRGNASRLSAEMIRDQALATSGLLDTKIGGPSVKPYEVAHGLKPMKPDMKNGLYRRSLYTWWQITSPAPVMTTFDASKRAVCRVSRDVTASPLQALVLLNGPEFIEAHRMLGVKMHTQFPKPEDESAMVEAVFRTLTSRVPDSREEKVFLKLYRDQLAYFQKKPAEAAALLKVGAAPKSKQIDDARQAAAAILVNTIFNLDECQLKR